jgi:hypothetical protein
MAASARGRLAKALIPVVVVGAFVFGIWRTARSTRSEPYALSAAAAQAAWRLAIEVAERPNDPVVVLQPPASLSRELFDQVFKRSMESMQSPQVSGIPLVLAGELERAGSRLPPDALLSMARTAGLEAAPPAPRCLAHRRLPEPDTRSQAYFAIFDSAPFATFRANIAARLGPTFDAGALTPALFVGIVESTLDRWVPLHADAEKDCVAPLTVPSRI